MKKKLLTIFPDATNVHLVKDVGMVPYMLHKYEGYESYLLCYKNGDYPYLESEVKGLKVIFLKKIFGKQDLDVLYFLMRNYRKFDVVMCFHMLRTTFIWLDFFKLLKGKNSITYLKLDGNDLLMNPTFFKHFLRSWYLKAIKKYTVVSIETKIIYDFLVKNWDREILYLPNGFYDWDDKKKICFKTKENLIITVGRIGDINKSNEILVDAFARISSKIPNWKLRLIGPVENDFEKYVETAVVKNNVLRNRIELVGPIYDKERLNKEYQQAKIFVLTSKSEGFPLVFLEAAKAGCFIVSSDITPAYDITDNERWGKLFPVGDSAALADVLLSTVNDEENLKEKCEEIQEFAYQKFYWPDLIRRLSEKLV